MSFWFALTMAAFTLLFGAREASATEPNRGIVVALGLESVLKLVALLAIGLYAALSVHKAGTPLLEKMAQLPPPAIVPDYLTMVALGRSPRSPCRTSSMLAWSSFARHRT